MSCVNHLLKAILKISAEDKLISFEVERSCDQKFSSQVDWGSACEGKSLEDILKISYSLCASDLKVTGEEEKFYLFVEWSILRCVIAQYLGLKDAEYDADRCFFETIEQHEEFSIIHAIIYPPTDMPPL